MKSTIGRYVVLLFLLTFIIWIACGDGDNPVVGNTNFEAEESFSFEEAVGSRSRLRLQAINGEITITGISGVNSVSVTGKKRVQSESTADAEAHLLELEVNVQGLANEVSVETTQPQDTDGRNYIVDYTITLPKNLEILLVNVNGLVKIDSINNSVTVTNVNGEVTLNEIVGSTSVILVNGIIDSEVTLPMDGTIDMSTVNGNINLDIPANTSAEFSATWTNGSISVSNLVLQNEQQTVTFRSGTLGDGQGTISLTTVNGIISISGF